MLPIYRFWYLLNLGMGGISTMRKTLALLALLGVFAVGCSTYKPVPDGYTGPVAMVKDTGIEEGSTKVQIFSMTEIDGNSLWDSFQATGEASYGTGALVFPSYVEHAVPCRTMQVKLVGSHVTGAPIHALFSQAAGTFFSVEGVTEFTPEPDVTYVVRGELKKGGSSVWIENEMTGEVVTARVTPQTEPPVVAAEEEPEQSQW
jgi:hypothetical protein